MNLFIGIIIFWFSKVEKTFKNKILTENQVRWLSFQKLCVNAKVNYKRLRPPLNSKTRMFFYNLVNSSFFESLIMFIILLNIIFMASIYDTAPKKYIDFLKILDYCFASTYFFEMLIKFYALGFSGYFYETWNKFDFSVIFVSFIDIIFGLIFSKNILLYSSENIIRSFRILRIWKMFRMVKYFEGIRKLGHTLYLALPKLLNIFALVVLILFIYTILGCFLFGKANSKGIILDDYVNFKNFFYGMMTLFKITTADDWSLIMYELSLQYSKFIFYFCLLIFLSFFFFIKNFHHFILFLSLLFQIIFF